MTAATRRFEALRRVEAALAVRYPASFDAGVDELVALSATSGFQRAFAGTRLLLEAEEVRKARIRVGGHLLPFMLSEGEHPDVYAFEPSLASVEPKVVTWCIHTTVHEWPGFPHFMAWLRRFCEQPAPSK
jgi:hypothetical protein